MTKLDEIFLSCITYRWQTLLLCKEPLKKKKVQQFKEEKNRQVL